MDVRIVFKAVGISLALWGLCIPSGAPAYGQSRGAPATLMPPQPAEQTALQQALEYEQREQWGDALLVYQQALKSQPDDPTLLHKRTVARIQYDLARRCTDHELLDRLLRVDARQAASIYAEVLQKIHTYHVESPDWHALSRYGLLSLNAALSHRAFKQHWLPRYSEPQITKAWDVLQQALQSAKVQQRSDSIWVAERTAQIMREQLAIPAAVVYHELIAGATAGLDLYSSFLTPDQYGDTMSQIDGNFVGLGVELKLQADGLSIVNVISQGPAGRGGIRPGDMIVAVDGQTVEQVGPERCADLLRGLEGSFVRIQVRRSTGAEDSLYLQRRRVEIPSLEDVAIVDPTTGTAYLRLVNFQKSTGQDLDAALWSLHHQGMRALIVDVRGNPGGLLTAAVDTANRFIEQGIIVSTRGRNPLEDFTHYAQAEGTWRVPLVVLIDEHSASASEIFAAAIADHQRGTIVGQQSYGKGSVQGIFPLTGDQGGLRLTTALFYSPRGTPISQRGVVPDLAVNQLAKPATGTREARPPVAQDPVVRSAINALQTPASPATSLRANVAGQ